MSDNNLKASLSVGVVYSGDGSGLTPQQLALINKVPTLEEEIAEVKDSVPTKTSELTNDSDFVTESEMQEAIANVSTGDSVDLSAYVLKTEIDPAIEEYVTENKDKLKGDKGDKGDTGATGEAGKDGADAVNPNFTIGTVTTLEAGSNATVTITGTYPNLVLNFGIPRGADGTGSGGEVEDTTVYMYYGRISLEEAGGGVIQYSDITEEMIITAVAVTKAEPSTLGKTSMGIYDDTAMGDYVVVAVPTANNYKVTKDNGIGGKVIFDTSTSGANGVNITINGVAYKLYGEILLSQNETFIYIDE